MPMPVSNDTLSFLNHFDPAGALAEYVRPVFSQGITHLVELLDVILFCTSPLYLERARQHGLQLQDPLRPVLAAH